MPNRWTVPSDLITRDLAFGFKQSHKLPPRKSARKRIPRPRARRWAVGGRGQASWASPRPRTSSDARARHREAGQPCGSFLSCVPALWMGGRCLTAPCQGSRSQGQLSSSRCQRRVGGKKGFPGTELYMTQVFRMINALQHGARVGTRPPRSAAEHAGERKSCSGAGSAGTARPRGAGGGGACRSPLACLPC